MPRPNQYLLLYVLDLLAVFARKSDKNLMTAANLAVMFQPGIISHPNHELSPQEHALSQRVLEFLIVNQDWFMLDIPPPTQGERHSRRSLSPKLGHNLVLVPSKESENRDDSSWYHVDKATLSPPMVTRRKTTLEHRTETQDDLAEGDLSPIAESPLSGISPAGVSRSRTLPSSRTRAFTVSAVDNVADNNNSAAVGHAERAKVLRKQKRSPLSQQPPSDWQGTTKEP